MFSFSVNDTEGEFGDLNTINITDHDTSKVVVSDLDTNSKYMFYLRAYTKAGLGSLIMEEGTTITEGGRKTLFIYWDLTAKYACFVIILLKS